MHEQKASRNEQYFSPFQFQQVFAFGKIDEAERPITDTNDATGRHYFSGDTQEDASQFYMALLDALAEDPHGASAEKLKELFTIQETEVVRCKESGCKHRMFKREVTSTTYDLRVPRLSKRQKPDEAIDLIQMFRGVARNEHEGKCPNCDKESLEQWRRISKPRRTSSSSCYALIARARSRRRSV